MAVNLNVYFAIYYYDIMIDMFSIYSNLLSEQYKWNANIGSAMNQFL